MFGCISKYFSKNSFWCLEKKKEEAKPRKTRTNPEEHGAISRSTERSRDRWCDLRSRSARTVLHEIVPSDRDRRCDLAKHRSRQSRSRKRCFARALFVRSRVLSLSRSPFARPQFRKSFEVKIGTEMNFRGQRYLFTVNWKWFPENSIFQTNQTAYFMENDFRKWFSVDSNTALISSNSNCVLSKHLLYAGYRIFMPFFFLSIHNFAFSKSIHCFFFFFGNSHFPIYLLRYWIEMYFCYNFHHWGARGSTTRQEICILGAKRWCVYGGRIKVKREGSR